MLWVVAAAAFDTSDPYERLHAYPYDERGPVLVAPLAYRRGLPRDGTELPVVEIEEGGNWRVVAEAAESVEAWDGLRYVRFPLDTYTPGLRHRVNWGDDEPVEFEADALAGSVEPPAVLGASLFTWQRWNDTAEGDVRCGLDIVFDGEPATDDARDQGLPELAAAGWLLLANTGEGETVLMEASRTYVARYNGELEAGREYSFDVYWVGPQAQVVPVGLVEVDTTACDAGPVPIDTADPGGDSGPGDTPGRDAEEECGCGGAASLPLVAGLCLLALARPGATRSAGTPRPPRTGPG